MVRRFEAQTVGEKPIAEGIAKAIASSVKTQTFILADISAVKTPQRRTPPQSRVRAIGNCRGDKSKANVYMEEMKLYYPHCADISLIERGVLCEGRQPGFNLSNSPGVIARCRQNESQRSRCQEESHVNLRISVPFPKHQTQQPQDANTVQFQIKVPTPIFSISL